MNYFNQSIEQVEKNLETNIKKGLSKIQVEKRLSENGFNQLNPPKQTPTFIKFLMQFNSPMVYILIFAAVVSYCLHEVLDAIVIGVILLINALLGFFQEHKADESVKKLISMNKENSIVLRDWKETSIESKYLVPWDIVILDAGYKVAADMRVIESYELKSDESALTGESLPSEKYSDTIEKKSLAVWDMDNMIFSWTYLTGWAWKAIVVETGMNTQLWNIASIVSSSKDKKTPLEQRLEKLGIQIWVIVLIVAAIVVAIWVYNWKSWNEIFMIAVSLAVSAIPEWLPAVVTLTLAIGVQNMFKKKVLVKKLNSIETLWSVDVICSDKTWTITQNKMKVTNIFLWQKDYDLTSDSNGQINIQNPDLKLLLNAWVNCNNAKLPNIWDPTEIALLQVAKDFNEFNLLEKTGQVPFNSENKYMISHHENISYIKWALENVLKLCDKILIDWKIFPLAETSGPEKYKENLLSQNKTYASNAIRVLWFWYKNPEDEKFIFIGMMGMIDPPRKWVFEAIQECKNAWIRVIMITWDNIETAKAIAWQIWLTWNAMTWEEFEATEDKLKAVKNTNIFARVNPLHKSQIADILQKLGHTVAMTWDWVNDAAAIKKADVWISMAITWTDVSKEASDMLLIDDNFVSIVNWVKQWRIIYDNMKKFVQFLLRVNFDEIILIIMSIILKLPMPLIALQVLWINLVTDSLPAVALGFDQWDKDVMNRPPRSKKEDILSWSWGFILLTTILCSWSLLLLYFYELKHNSIETMRTIIATTIIFTELLLAYSIRSDKKNFWQLPANWHLNLAVLASLWFHLLALFTPLGKYFEFTPLGADDWKWVFMISFWVFTIIELLKVFRRKKV